MLVFIFIGPSAHFWHVSS